jgi:hypothetical protein
MKPFQAMLPEIPIDRATWAGSKITKVGRGRAVVTRVTLPDGYSASFVGAMSKGSAIRNALYQHQRARGRNAPRSGDVRRTQRIAGHRDYPIETEFEVGPKSYTVEGVMRVWQAPTPPGDEPFGPEDLYRDKWEIVVQHVAENVAKKPYYRPVPLGPFVRSFGPLVKAKLESAYMARAEAEEERRRDR